MKSQALELARRRKWMIYALLFLGLWIIYVATGNVEIDRQSPDAVAAALPAWRLATHGTLRLDQVLTFNPWVFVSHHHLVSNRQPGVVFFAVPFYLLLGQAKMNMFPAVVAAATASSGAVLLLGGSLRNLVSQRWTITVGAFFAFGTATWSVASDTLWPHGPDLLFLAGFLFFLSKNRQLSAALALALAVPVRAHLAVVALVAGVWFAVQRRSWRPLATFGLPAGVGIAVVSAYNHWMFGTWSLQGGYDSYVTKNLEGAGSGNWSQFFTNLLGAFFSPERGLLVWCPVLVVVAFGVRQGWRAAPSWARLSATAGAAYSLVQLKLNYFSGGDRFWSYRLTLELLMLTAPLLAVTAVELIAARRGARRWLWAAAFYCVTTQALGAIFYKPDNVRHDPWTHSKLIQLLSNGDLAPRALAAAGLLVMLSCLLIPRRRRSPHPAEVDDPAAAAVLATVG
jgi:hypothetical protein